MNLQPHQRQFAHTYTGPAYSQPPQQQQQQQQQQNFAGPNAPEPCYNCGSSQHVAQHCREARRAVPAGSLNPTSRSQRGGPKKNNSKPIVTRFAPPPNYTNGPYPQQPPFPQIGPSRPHQQSLQQQPQKQWQQSPQSYGPPVQAWQQSYVTHTTVSSQASTYSPRQPQAPQHGYSKPAQPPYPQQQHSYGYPPKSNWTTPTQPPTHQRPPQSHYSTAPQVHHQVSYVQTQNHQQYQQQQPIQSPYTPMTPQGFPQIPPAQNYHRTHGPQPQKFAQQAAAPINTPTSQQQPPPPKPPPCFPSAERIANPTAKSGVIIWRPAQPTEIPLAATFVETDEQRALKQSTGLHTGLPRSDGKKKHFSKYCDAKGNRMDRDLTAYEVGSEMMKDPVFTSVRTGESMVAQPLDFVLPDDPEEELEEVAVGESANELGLENGMRAETEDPMGDLDGSSEGTEAGDEQKSNTQKGLGKRKAKMHGSTGIADGKKVEGALSETKRSWNRQSNTSIQGNNNGARGRNNGGNQGKRKSRSPLDNSRPQKHRVRETPVSTSTSSIQPHHGLPTPPPLSLPSHHPLPPKPVVAPPPPQNFHHGNNRPQNSTPNRPQGAGNRRNQGYKQRNHPYARRSASPVRHMLVDNQRRDYGQKGKGRGQHGQQQVSGGGQ